MGVDYRQFFLCRLESLEQDSSAAGSVGPIWRNRLRFGEGMAQDSSSSKGGIVALLIPALVAVAGGAGLGLYLGDLQQQKAANTKEQPTKAQHAAEPANGHAEHKSGHGDAGASDKIHEEARKLTLKPLPAIVTNLASPSTALIRLQSAIIYDAAKLENPDIFISELSSDIVAYLKTLPISSIEGAEGLRELNENLADRAAIRSKKAVHEFVIESMVIQ